MNTGIRFNYKKKKIKFISGNRNTQAFGFLAMHAIRIKHRKAKLMIA